MKVRSICGLLTLAGLLALAGPCLWAQDGLEGALSQSTRELRSHLAYAFSPSVAAADLDGDNKPDGAVLLDSNREQSTVHKIQIHFSGRLNTDLTFESDEPTLAISALDINRDGATDIVVEQPLTHKRLQVWLNDGHGDFRKGRTQDYPSFTGSSCQRVQSQPERQYGPALGLPSRVDFEIAAVAGSDSPASSSSYDKRPGLIAWMAETRATTPRSPRAPPLPCRL